MWQRTSDGRTPVEVAEAIAPHLGDGWTAAGVPDGTGGLMSHSAHLTHPDGRRLFLRTGQYDIRGKVAVSAVWPGDTKELRNGPPNLDCKMSDHRDGRAMAGEIARRVLPGYGPELERVRAELAARSARIAAQEAVVARVASAVPGTSVHERTVSLPFRSGQGVWGSVTVSSGGATATVELRQVPCDLAMEIMRLVTG